MVGVSFALQLEKRQSTFTLRSFQSPRDGCLPATPVRLRGITPTDCSPRQLRFLPSSISLVHFKPPCKRYSCHSLGFRGVGVSVTRPSAKDAGKAQLKWLVWCVLALSRCKVVFYAF